MALGLNFDIYADFVGDQAFNELRRRLADVEAQFKKMESATGSFGKAVNDNFKGMNGNVSNISAQFQDIAVQLAGGQSPFLIALQQGTQLGAVLGQQGGGVGGAVKALGAGFMSLINPVNLAVIAGTALIGTVAQWAMSSSSGADAATEAMKRHDDVLKQIRDRYPEMEAANWKYRESTTRLALAAQNDVLTQQKAQADAFTKVQATISRAAKGAYEYGVIFRESFDPQEKIAAIDAFRQKMESLKATASNTPDALRQIADEMARLAQQAQSPEIRKYAQEISDAAASALKLQSNVSESESAVRGLNEAMSSGIAKAEAFGKALRSLSAPSARMSERDKAWAAYYEGRINASDMGQIDQLEKALQKRLTELDTLDAYGGTIPSPQSKPNVLSFDPYKQSGGGAAESEEKRFERAAAAITKKTAALQAENAAYGQNTSLQQADIAFQQALINLKSQGVALTPKRLDALKQETDALREQLKVQDDLRQQQQAWQDFRAGFESVFGSVVNSLESGTDAMDAFRKSMKNLLFQAAQKGFMNLLFGPAGGVGGGLFGGLFRAEGGNVTSGNPYIVGEQGPELFFPGRSGTIAPASATAEIMATRSGGMVFAPVTNIDARGADAGAVARLERGMAARDKAMKTSVLGIVGTARTRNT